MKTGQQRWCVDNLESRVLCLAFSPDGTKILTGRDDGTVQLRDTATGKECTSFKGHTAKVNCVAFSANGQLAASGSDDTNIVLWQLP